MLVAKTISLANVVLAASGPINSDSTITVGCAIAILIAVWHSGRKLKGYEIKIDGLDPRFQKLETSIDELKGQVENLKHERAWDLDMMRSETSAGNYPPVRADYRILIVDDDVNDRKLLRRALHRFAVEEANNLREAVAKCKTKQFDCVVLDLGLPDSNRQQTVANLMQAYPGAVCVAISGSNDSNLASMAVAAGAHSYMVKGRDEEYLERMVIHAIRRKSLRKENL